MAVGTESPISQLDRALAAVGELISNIRPAGSVKGTGRGPVLVPAARRVSVSMRRANVGVAFNAHVENTSSFADVADVTHKGHGRGVKVALTNGTNAADAVTVGHFGTGTGVNASTLGGTAVAANSATGIGLLATASNAASVNPVVKAHSNGKGQAVLAANTAAATLPTVVHCDATCDQLVSVVRALPGDDDRTFGRLDHARLFWDADDSGSDDLVGDGLALGAPQRQQHPPTWRGTLCTV